ncbi:ABC transporter permease [Microbacterium caowuchunii]|uniref:ABC transporter permease n=1 Tax=Microbacterium caowuchunii TaxID=2614638 RepID=A0A5N0TCH7_9MICO|nr:ABC transporter permease [Microbacterium caowuchunii]KAA9132134.1 ABC transporter permease [Microbacterium caowuchunii]
MTIAPVGDETVTRTVAIARARSRRRFRPRNAILGIAGILVFLAIWEIASQTGLVNPTYLPPPTVVIPHLFQIATFPDFWLAVGDTMLAWGLGMLIALVLACVLGVIIGLSPFLRRATNSTVEFLRPIPSVALIPLAVLLFGIRIESTLLLVVYAAFWQIFIQVLYGVADVDQVAMSTGRSYGFSKWQRIRDIIFPTALPYLMTGIRLASAIALILAITAQLIIGTPGLGREIAFAQNAGNYATMYALSIATGLLGVLINIGARALERRLLAWHTSVRGDVTT